MTNRGAESLQSIFSSFYLIYLKTIFIFKGKKEYILNAVNYLIFFALMGMRQAQFWDFPFSPLPSNFVISIHQK